jgi:N-ethylmaleimide reductase
MNQAIRNALSEPAISDTHLGKDTNPMQDSSTVKSGRVPSILTPYKLGNITLSSRIVMAPMTRARAMHLTPDADTATYYTQRAGAGLIVTEGISISVEARGAVFIPGIYNDEQINAWQAVTAGVHARGGHIFAQLWHVGRAGHVSHNNGEPPVSSTATRANALTFALDENGIPGRLPQSAPRALHIREIPRLVADYASAARNAMTAGFDGVEIHGANGYLPEQFINGALNTRTDAYGGSIENRLRLPLEIVDAVAGTVGSTRTGLRVAPFGRFNDMHPYDDEEATWMALADALSRRNLAYLHLSDQESLGQTALSKDIAFMMRKAFGGNMMIAGGFGLESGQAAIDADRCDLVAIGRPFISNPDLVERYRNGWPVTPFDPSKFYGGTGPQGYIDYPTFPESLR